MDHAEQPVAEVRQPRFAADATVEATWAAEPALVAAVVALELHKTSGIYLRSPGRSR